MWRSGFLGFGDELGQAAAVGGSGDQCLQAALAGGFLLGADDSERGDSFVVGRLRFEEGPGGCVGFELFCEGAWEFSSFALEGIPIGGGLVAGGEDFCAVRVHLILAE